LLKTCGSKSLKNRLRGRGLMIKRLSPVLWKRLKPLLKSWKKAGQEISQVKRVQDAAIQRLDEKLKEAATQECLIGLRAELRALHEQAVVSGKEAKGVQSFIEQSQKAEAAAQEVLSSLRAEVVALSKDLAQVTNQCRSAQSANEVTLQGIEGKSQKAEAATQRDLSRLKKKAETLTEEHLKTGEEVKQLKRAQDALILSLDEKLNTVEAANQLALNTLRGDFGTFSKNSTRHGASANKSKRQCSKGSRNNLRGLKQMPSSSTEL
jgi:hypothetical protein